MTSQPMKRIQPLISLYLALCLAGGGAVALSPTLHRLIEHGGHGDAHTHAAILARDGRPGEVHQHEDGHWHSHPAERPRRVLLFEHTFDPPTISLTGIWHRFARFLEAATAEDSAPANEGPGHQHHSLFQLLAAGFVDQPLDAPCLLSLPPAHVVCEVPPANQFTAFEWDAQTASRGPPVS
jgi:hypothetical protein